MKIPQLRRHKSAGQAYVRLEGRQVYLGPWPAGQTRPSEIAEAAYRRLVTRLMAAQAPDREVVARPVVLTVSGLVAAYLEYGDRRYQKDGESTGQMVRVRGAARILVELHGPRPAAEIRVTDLELVQDAMQNRPCAWCEGTGRIDEQRSCKRCDGHGRKCWARRLINQSIACILQMFRWSARRGAIPAETIANLDLIEPLRPGQGGTERPMVRPITDAVLEATIRELGPVPAAMVRVQVLAGMRPQEVCGLTVDQINRDGVDPDGIRHEGVWVYTPTRHKTQHHGRERVIFLGPQAQAVLELFLAGRKNGEHIFSPRRAIEQLRSAAGQTHTVPASRAPGDYYLVSSYGHAIKAACRRAGVPPWTPNQLRHLAATRIRANSDLDTAGTVLDHANLETTRIYAERSRARAAEIMRRLG